MGFLKRGKCGVYVAVAYGTHSSCVARNRRLEAT
jgi:hypothetical protein